MYASNVIIDLMELKNPNQAEINQRFFKTGHGEYGEGDKFLGIIVPKIREVTKEYTNLPLSEINILLNNQFHEVRLAAAILLTYKYEKSNDKEKGEIFKFYIKQASKMNNWDLVDVSAPKIVGEYLLNTKKDLLDKLIQSKDKWVRRIAMVSTITFIRNGKLTPTFKLAKVLMKDDFDLSHKATGWMLRETGKQDLTKLKDFLNKHISWMPRTTLRYAIERFPEKERKKLLKKKQHKK